MAVELFNKANDEYVSENYQRAVELFSEALALDKQNEDILVNRAQAFLKLNQYNDAISDCDEALALNSTNFKAYLRKGIALFNLEDYSSALKIFKEGFIIKDDSSLLTWMEKCEAKLKESKTAAPSQNDGKSHADVPVEASVNPEIVQANAPVPVKRRYDWYQTQTHVVVAVLHKNVKKEALIVNTDQTKLHLNIKLDKDEDFTLDLLLAHPIVPEQTQTKILTSKIEIKLKKAEELQWTNLEGDGRMFCLKLPSVEAATAINSDITKRYPSSSHYTRNWDKLEQEVKEEEKNEKLEGDAALNKLFQQIYADGTDDVKKAMMKSFSESGGTVLSTNWAEVGKEKVEVKPPDGMEFKKYEL